MGPMLYNTEKILEYVECMKKHNRNIERYNELVKKNNKDLVDTINKYIDRSTSNINIGKNVINIADDDKEKLQEMAKNILASVKQNEKYSEDIEGFKVEIDHEKGMVLFRPKKITRVRIVVIPKSKYYGRKRNKMINTYHKY